MSQGRPLGRLSRRATRAVHAATAAVCRAVFPARGAVAPVPPARVRRVLLLRQDAVGDLIVSTPALAYLARVAPHAEVDVLASPRNAALLDGDARAARVFVNAFRWRDYPRLLAALRARDYDVILAAGIHKHRREGLLSALVARRHTVRATLWRPRPFRGLFTHVVRPPVAHHMAHRVLYLAQAAVGDAPPRRPPDVACWPYALAHDPAADARAAALTPGPEPTVLVSLWTRDPRRDVPTTVMRAALATLAARCESPTFLVAPPAHAAGRAEGARLVADLAEAGYGDRVRLAPDDLSLPELVALVRRTALVVTANTAPVHIASAVGVPVVGVYAPIARDVVEWAPLGVPSRVVVPAGGRPLAELHPDEIVRAFDALWPTAAERLPEREREPAPAR